MDRFFCTVRYSDVKWKRKGVGGEGGGGINYDSVVVTNRLRQGPKKCGAVIYKSLDRTRPIISLVVRVHVILLVLGTASLIFILVSAEDTNRSEIFNCLYFTITKCDSHEGEIPQELRPFGLPACLLRDSRIIIVDK